jgi:hypothetical protein
MFAGSGGLPGTVKRLATITVTAGAFLVGSHTLSPASAHAWLAECDGDYSARCDGPDGGGGSTGTDTGNDSGDQSPWEDTSASGPSNPAGGDGGPQTDPQTDPQSNVDPDNGNPETKASEDAEFKEPTESQPRHPMQPVAPLDPIFKADTCHYLSSSIRAAAYNIDDLRARLGALGTEDDLSTDPDDRASIRKRRRQTRHRLVSVQQRLLDDAGERFDLGCPTSFGSS